MNKRLSCYIAFMLFSLSCFGQQLPLFTQYHDLQSVINPAAITSDYFALDHNVSIGASYRTQWVGINNNPQTQVLRGDYFNADGAGFSLLAGGSVMNDQTGPTGFTGIYGKIGGVISGDPAYEGLSLALNLGMVQYRVDITEIKFRDENDILAMENQAEVFMDAGFGLFYYRSVGSNSNMIYGGVSVPQLFGADLTFNADTDAFQLQKIQHLYGLLGYYKFLGDGAYLEPTVWIKTTKGAEMNVQGSIRYQFPSALWIGTGAGTSGIYHFETGLNLGYGLGYPNIKIGYSYDYSFSKISTSSRSSHQFNITYSFEY